jgi:hypothetical protein
MISGTEKGDISIQLYKGHDTLSLRRDKYSNILLQAYYYIHNRAGHREGKCTKFSWWSD